MARREEILRAAQNAFLKYGIEKITLDDIAQECGVKKTALYYYFKNKDEIMMEMILLRLREFEAQVKEAVEAAENVREKLRTYMKMKINLMKENMPFIKLLDKEFLPVRAKEFMQLNKVRIMEADFCLVKEVILQGIKNHKVSFKLNDSLVLMILGVTHGAFVGRYLEEANWNIDEMIDTTIEVIFNGIE